MSPSTTRDRAVCGLITELAARIDETVRTRSRGTGVTATQAVALRELTEPLTLTALARRMCCAAPNASYVVDRLEESGHVVRRPHPDDRRARLVELTPSGEELRTEVLAHLMLDSPLEALDDAEVEQLSALLRRALDADGSTDR